MGIKKQTNTLNLGVTFVGVSPEGQRCYQLAESMFILLPCRVTLRDSSKTSLYFEYRSMIDHSGDKYAQQPYAIRSPTVNAVENIYSTYCAFIDQLIKDGIALVKRWDTPPRRRTQTITHIAGISIPDDVWVTKRGKGGSILVVEWYHLENGRQLLIETETQNLRKAHIEEAIGLARTAKAEYLEKVSLSADMAKHLYTAPPDGMQLINDE